MRRWRDALAHGDVTPQRVDTTGLDNLGAAWREANPYRGNPVALKIGASGFIQNCARCHGLQAVSGGMAPDLRYLDKAETGDFGSSIAFDTATRRTT